VLGTAIDPANLGSRRSMTSIGFEVWPIGDVPACAFEPCTGCQKRAGLDEGVKCCSEFLRLSDEQKRRQVAILLAQVVPSFRGEPADETFPAPRVALSHRTDPASTLAVSVECLHLRSVPLLRSLGELCQKPLPF